LAEGSRNNKRLAGILAFMLIVVGIALFFLSVYLAVKGTLIASLVSLAAGFAAITSGAEMVKGAGT
jgi:hypothetical protein